VIEAIERNARKNIKKAEDELRDNVIVSGDGDRSP
jgi:hypothetical protein